MREIKFRGMTIEGNWRYGLVARRDTRDKRETFISVGNAPFAFEIRFETLGQYSGRNDRDNIEIYEGDIIEWRNHYRNPQPNSPHVGYVKYDPGGLCFGIFNSFNDEWCDNSDWYGAITDTKVIGNIYENPELLSK